MIRNYLLIATRTLKNNLFYTAINVFGLSVGIACCLVLVLFLADQYSYDKHNKNVDHIYRVVNKQFDGNRSNYVSITQGVLVPELLKNFTEVKAATRLTVFRKSVVVDKKELSFDERIMAVDSSFFSIFTVPMKVGTNPGKGISQGGILISESAALTLFGTSDPIGKVISLRDFVDLTVTGVYQDFPYQSHLVSDYIISFSWIEKTEPQALSWDSNSYFSYVLMSPGFNGRDFNERLNNFIHQFTPNSFETFQYYLQPITDIHLANIYKPMVKGSVGKIILRAFSMIAILVLLLACFNYMNMATARSSKRSLEVGIRKVVGAYRSQLIFQFLTESLIICTLAFLLALLWADIGIPVFNAFTGWKLSINTFLTNHQLLGGIVGGNIVLAFLAGSYPAFFLSRFTPSAVIKSQQIHDSSKRLRKGLVLIQFTFTSVLIILITIVFKQVDFMKSRDLGFNQKDLMLFATNRDSTLSLTSFKAELQKIPGVKMISAAFDFPSNNSPTVNVWPVNSLRENNIKTDWLFVDHEYIPVLELHLLAGRNFHGSGVDKNKGVIVNEKAVVALGWTAEEAIGKKLAGFIFKDSVPGEVIGVIKDFHASTLRREIAPLLLCYGTDSENYIVKLDGTDPVKTSKQIESTVKHLFPEAPYDFLFFEDYLVRIYSNERRTGEVFTFFTILAIIIGCLGLYALSAYEGERRIKELGIRKIMGASTLKLLILISLSFMKLVVISLIIAMPIAYYLGNIWLRTFAYQVPWSVALFVKPSVCMLLLGWFTILYQALKAANLNPVEALRYE